MLLMLAGGCVTEPPPADEPVGAPGHLLVTGRGQTPPDYTLRWTSPTGVEVDRYNVFRSTAAITDENRAAALVSSPTTESLALELAPDSGTQFFRVSAVDADGNEGPLSIELRINTTRRAAFRADVLEDGLFEVFTVPLAGGTPIRASGVVSTGRTVYDYAWSPDGRFIAFTADLDVQGRRELYVSVVGAGAAPIKMSGATVPWANVTAFAWAPDAQRIAFVADRLSDEVFDLYVSPLSTGTPRLVSQFLLRRQGYDGVRQFAWSPDGARLAYTSDALTDNLFELFTARSTTSAVQRASAALSPQGDALDGVSDFAWSPDPSVAALAYLANATRPGVRELFVVPAIGGGVLSISGPLVDGGTVSSFAWAPDASRIAFLADKTIAGAIGLWSVLPTGGTVTPISGLPLPGTAVTEFAWSRDAATVAFHGDIEIPGLPGLYAADPDGADLRRISGELVSTTTVLPGWMWSPDASRAAFRGTLSIRETQELFLAAADGSGVTPAIPPLLAGRNVAGFAWSADGSRIIYIADLEVDDQFALYLAPSDTAQGVSVRLDGFLPAFGNVTHAAASPLCADDVPAGARIP